jgi:hypothetical protein
MLTNYLPGIFPEDAETTVADEFKDILEQYDMLSSPIRKHRRIPDSVVKVLLIGICDGLSVNGTLFDDKSKCILIKFNLKLFIYNYFNHFLIYFYFQLIKV